MVVLVVFFFLNCLIRLFIWVLRNCVNFVDVMVIFVFLVVISIELRMMFLCVWILLLLFFFVVFLFWVFVYRCVNCLFVLIVLNWVFVMIDVIFVLVVLFFKSLVNVNYFGCFIFEVGLIVKIIFVGIVLVICKRWEVLGLFIESVCVICFLLKLCCLSFFVNSVCLMKLRLIWGLFFCFCVMISFLLVSWCIIVLIGCFKMVVVCNFWCL